MLKQRARFVAAGLRLADMGELAVAFPMAYYVRDQLLGTDAGGLYPISRYWSLLAASLLVWQVSAWLARVYGAYRTRGIATEILRLARAFLLLGVVMAAAEFAWKQHDVSRLFFGVYYAVAFTLLCGTRFALRLVAHAARRRGYNTRAFAVVGSGEMPENVVAAIREHREWGYTYAGTILEDDAPESTDAPVLGRLSQLADILAAHVLDEVIFVAPRQRLEVIERSVRLCEEQGVGVKVLLDLFPSRISTLTVEELDGMPMLALSPAPSDVAPLAGKRVFDVVVSALVLLVSAPLALVIAVAIKLDSHGPVLFRQRRIGLHGREFRLYKFRSMIHGAERQLPRLKHRNEMRGPVFKMRDDPRVTRIGRLLRKTSLDELPQFWNVLKGDMSVVGPRPPIPSEVKQYERWHRRRLSVKPGITCTWQVSGRNEVEFDRWMELDLHYIDNWSLWHDLKIVLQTIPAVILGKGAR